VLIIAMLFVILDNWYAQLNEYQEQYNTAPHRSLGQNRSSFEVFFGRKPNFDLALLGNEIEGCYY